MKRMKMDWRLASGARNSCRINVEIHVEVGDENSWEMMAKST
jgi:hypothetical protein